MKKIVAMLVGISMLVSVTACGKAANQDATTGKTNEELERSFHPTKMKQCMPPMTLFFI